MKEDFFKAFSFDLDRSKLYNGSIELMIPNLPQDYARYHVEVLITAEDYKGKQKEKDEKKLKENRMQRDYARSVRGARRR